MRGGSRAPRNITAFGRTQTATEWGREFGISPQAITQRIDACGWDVERALTTPVATQGVYSRSTPLWEGANTLPWEEDDRCWYLVAHCGEMTLAQVGSCFGLNRERVRQVQEQALNKAYRACIAEGITLADLLGRDEASVWERLELES